MGLHSLDDQAPAQTGVLTQQQEDRDTGSRELLKPEMKKKKSHYHTPLSLGAFLYLL